MAAVDRAVENIRERILAGELTGGDRLGEVELATELGMSRTPVRQALLRLAAEGLVEVTPNRGARVLVRSDRELEHVFVLRARLEGLAARQSAELATAAQIDMLHVLAHQLTRFLGNAELATDAQIDLLDELAHQIGVYAEKRDLQSVSVLNSQFHGLLIEISNSATLARSVAGLMHASVLARTQNSFDDAAQRRSVAHHIEIVAALRAHDGEWAESVMHAHLLSARASLLGPRRRPVHDLSLDEGDL